MTEHRPDTDEREEPAGTPSPGPGNLTSRPVVPGEDGGGAPKAVPGAYEADDDQRARGKEWKRGN
jgi:hypothetical protein